jgi:hypothetical protein
MEGSLVDGGVGQSDALEGVVAPRESGPYNPAPSKQANTTALSENGDQKWRKHSEN